MSGLSSGDPDDPAVTGDDAADPGVMPARDEDVAVDELGGRPRRVSAHTFGSPSDTYTQSGSSSNAGHGRVGDEERSFTVGLEAKSHVSRVVAGRGKRRDSRSELHVTRDGLEAVEERLDAATNVRPVCLRPREREGVGVHGVPRSGKKTLALEVRVPAQVIDVQVREEDEVHAVAGDAELP